MTCVLLLAALLLPQRTGQIDLKPTKPAVITAVSAVPIAGSSTNAPVTITNGDMIILSNYVFSSAYGINYQLTIDRFPGDHVTYSSLTPSIQTVDANGRTTYVTPGTAEFHVRQTVAGLGNVGYIASAASSITNGQWYWLSFSNFIPGTLAEQLYTNFVSATNGKSTAEMQRWAERSHPESWPDSNPVLRWNSNHVFFGVSNMTSMSPCSEMEIYDGVPYPGQIPVTALTRRHGITRGHYMGDEGLNSRRQGERIFFLTQANQLVATAVHKTIVRWSAIGDYTIILFTNDLPTTIQPVEVITYETLTSKLTQVWPGPQAFYEGEQTGRASLGINPWIWNTWKAGDSGSPNMICMTNKLVLFGIRSGSTIKQSMQDDMDTLSTDAGLNPANYQLRYVDLSMFPDY